MAQGLKLTGDKDLIKRLKRLGSTVARRVVRQSTTAALTPMVKAMRREAPKDTGTLKKSIGKVVRTYRRSGVVWGAVGPRKGFETANPDGSARIPTKYAHLVERHNPFMRRAFDSTSSQVLRTMVREVRKRIEKAAKRK